MFLHDITDWDDAYENAGHIVGGANYLPAWAAAAAAFRASAMARPGLAYGSGAREALDLFLPDAAPAGLLVFVHGGYWSALDRSYWSHLAGGATARGWAVAIPSYDLCPAVTIAEITRQIGAAVTLAAGEVAGPLVLTGHSAGGHLVTEMAAEGSPLAPEVRARLAHVVTISGLHDLRPLLATSRNATLGLDDASAAAGSPALKRPGPGTRLTAWVGGAERAEFRRQTALIANIWRGLGAVTREVTDGDRHHFDVVDGLADPASPLTDAALAPAVSA